MRIPVKPEHQPELSYLLGEVFHLQKIGAPAKKVTAAMEALGNRQLALYPELSGRRTSMTEDAKFIEIYDNFDAYVQAIRDQAEREKEAPFIALASKKKGPGKFDVLGPPLKED